MMGPDTRAMGRFVNVVRGVSHYKSIGSRVYPSGIFVVFVHTATSAEINNFDSSKHRLLTGRRTFLASITENMIFKTWINY